MGPPPKATFPLRNKQGLMIRVYEKPLVSLNKALLTHYYWGGSFGGGGHPWIPLIYEVNLCVELSGFCGFGAGKFLQVSHIFYRVVKGGGPRGGVSLIFPNVP